MPPATITSVRWVETIRRLGDELPDEYKVKRETWLGAIDPEPRIQSG